MRLVIASLFSAVFALAVSLHAQASAPAPQLIEWNDLVPKLPPLVDPLEQIGAEQRIELETILWVRQLTKDEREQRPEVVAEANQYEEAFAKRGLSIDQLIRDYAVWSQEITRRHGLMNDGLAGKHVSIRGYLLPLEFDDGGVVDFLLVPYVGACIHVPAPPPNQIVLVKLREKLVVRDLFTPVLVSGKLAVSSSTPSLTLVDGSAPVDVGYRMADAAFQLVE